MAASKTKPFVDCYSEISYLLRDIYVYGCYPRKEYIGRGLIKSGSYDKSWKRIQFYIAQEFISGKNTGERVDVNRIEHDRYQNIDNYLARTYKQCAMRSGARLVALIGVLQYAKKKVDISKNKGFLSQSDKEFSYQEVMEYVSIYFPSGDGRKVVSSALETLIDEGVLIRKIEATGEKNNCVYFMQDDLFEGLSLEELEELYYAVMFYSHKSPFATPAILLKDTIQRYANLEWELEPNDITVFEYDFMQRVFNDEVTNSLIDAIQAKETVLVTYQDESPSKILYPIELRSEYWYGRQYVLGIDAYTNEAVFIRLDLIKQVITLNKLQRKKQMERDIDINIDYKFNPYVYESQLQDANKSWIASMRGDSQTIALQFRGDNNIFDLQRVKRDKRHGIIRENEDGTFVFEIDIKDWVEMKPWIRRFGKNVKILDTTLQKVLDDERKEMLTAYGVVSEK